MLDLSLAETYVPGCACVAKTGLLCGLLSSLRLAGVPALNTYVLGAALLFVDRHLYVERIFSTNALTSFVLFAVAVEDGRSVPREEVDFRKGVLGLALGAYWAAVALGALMQVQTYFSVFRYVPFRPLPLSAVLLVVHSFLLHEREFDPWVCVRVASFLVLSLAWIYVVNARNICAHGVYDCTDCVVFFGHVLFTALPVAAVSVVLLAGALLYLRPRGDGAPAEDCKSASSTQSDAPPEQSDIEALFHAARAQARQRTPGDSI